MLHSYTCALQQLAQCIDELDAAHKPTSETLASSLAVVHCRGLPSGKHNSPDSGGCQRVEMQTNTV
jgi:hypothetical protein